MAPETAAEYGLEEGDWVSEGQILAELENDRERIQLEKADLTVAGLLLGTKTGRGYTVDMGEARTGWRDIPLPERVSRCVNEHAHSSQN